MWPSLKDGPLALNGIYEKGVISVSESATDTPRNVLRHEVIHALRDAQFWGREYGLFSRGEWRSLVQAARGRKDLMKRIRSEYSDLPTRAQIEEVIAEMYREWGDARDTGTAVDRLLQRISDALTAIANALRGNRLTSAARVFERIESGEVGGRGPNPGASGGNAKQMRAMQRWQSSLMRLLKNPRQKFPELKVGSTGAMLERIGVPKGMIYISGSKIRKVISDHPEAREALMRLPELLENTDDVF